MTVKEFVKLDKSGIVFVLIDATKVGYMTKPEIITAADKNVVTTLYGDKEVIGFEPTAKKSMNLYVK